MASKPVANFLLRPIIRSSKIISPSILRPDPLLPRTLQPAARRFAHTIPKPPGHPTTPEEQQQARRRAQPHYKITFTCKPCGHRSEHEVSKTGYYHGSVLITCPSCRNRHIISDHLGIFGDRKITVEDLMREKGQLVKRGTLGEYGDIEFWQDKEHFESDDDYYKIKDKPENPLEEADPDVVSEEQEAAKSQETRNPSSQSTDRKPASSALLGDSGTRPSIGDSQHKDPVPSTRRQLSTVIQPTPCKPGVSGRDFLRASMTDGKSYSELHQLLQEYLTGPRSRRVERGLRRALAERRSMLNRVPKEEMLSKVNQVYAEQQGGDANAGSPAQGTPGEAVDQTPEKTTSSSIPRYLSSRKRMTSREFLRVRYHRVYPPRYITRIKQYPKSTIMEPPTVRRPLFQSKYDGVRLYDFPTVDSRPQYIRTGPGPLYKRRRPTPWTGRLLEEEKASIADQDDDMLDPEIPFQWEMPADVSDGPKPTVYPTTARRWPKPRAPSYTSVYQKSEERYHFYKAVAVRRAEKQSRVEKTPVPIAVVPRPSSQDEGETKQVIRASYYKFKYLRDDMIF